LARGITNSVSHYQMATRRTSGAISIGAILGRTVVYVVMAAIAVTTIGPFVIMLSASLTKSLLAVTFPFPLIPHPITLDNFALLFRSTMALRWLLNSFIVSGVSTLGCLFTSSMAGYAFARGKFRGRDLIFTLFLAILMMPTTAQIVPEFIVLSKLHLINTYTALIAPWFASIFGTFMLRQHYLSIPRDYDDAAIIDGASRFQIYYRVLLPQLRPALATLAVLRFMGNWNDFLYPLIVTTRQEMRTLTVGLTTVNTGGANAGLDMAGAVMGFLPTFIIFMIGQRYLVEGVTLTGIKG